MSADDMTSDRKSRRRLLPWGVGCGFLTLLLGIGLGVVAASGTRCSPSLTCRTASPVVASPDGSAKAWVEQKETMGGGWDEPPFRALWELAVLGSDGVERRCHIRGHGGNREAMVQSRSVGFELSWREDGRIIRWKSTDGRAGKAYWLGTGVTVADSPHVPGGEPRPLAGPLAEALRAIGRPDEEIGRLSYLQVQGHYCGANSVDIVNEDENVLLVVGPEFATHGKVISYGPVIGFGDASFSRCVATAKWVAFCNNHGPHSEVIAEEILVGGKRTRLHGRSTVPPKLMPPATHARFSAALDAALGSYSIEARIASSTFPCVLGGEAMPLTEDLRERLRRIGLTSDEIDALKYTSLQGEYLGAASKDFICKDPGVLLVVGPEFSGHGDIISVGPVLLIGQARASWRTATASWIFFDDRSGGRGDVKARKIYAAPDADLRMGGPSTLPVQVPARKE